MTITATEVAETNENMEVAVFTGFWGERLDVAPCMSVEFPTTVEIGVDGNSIRLSLGQAHTLSVMLKDAVVTGLMIDVLDGKGNQHLDSDADDWERVIRKDL